MTVGMGFSGGSLELGDGLHGVGSSGFHHPTLAERIETGNWEVEPAEVPQKTEGGWISPFMILPLLAGAVFILLVLLC